MYIHIHTPICVYVYLYTYKQLYRVNTYMDRYVAKVTDDALRRLPVSAMPQVGLEAGQLSRRKVREASE